MHHKRRKYLYRHTICFVLCLLGLLLLGEQQAWAQDKSGTPAVKVRRKKKKIKKLNPNREARSVKDSHQKPSSQPTNFSHKDQYSRPASKRKSKKVKNNYQRPRSLTNSGQVKDAYQSPRSLKRSGQVDDRYQPPRSLSNAGRVKDDYQRPKSISRSEKVKVSDARPLSEPSAEEGQEKSHLPLLDQLFNRHNRYFRQKERYLENLSLQLSGYQGNARVRKSQVAPGGSRRDKSVGNFEGKVTFPSRVAQRKSYKKMSAEQGSFTGHIRQLRPYLQEKVDENKAYYISGHKGWLRVPTPQAQTRYHKKLASQVHQYTGDIRIKKRKPGENMHPSVHHLARRGKASYEQKERHRKRRIWITHIFKSKEQPQHLKEKTRKPRYDNKESDIWYY